MIMFIKNYINKILFNFLLLEKLKNNIIQFFLKKNI